MTLASLGQINGFCAMPSCVALAETVGGDRYRGRYYLDAAHAAEQINMWKDAVVDRFIMH